MSLIPGAAIEEGTLKPGDRLLEVNDVCVDGMSQSDVVTLLRNVPLDSTVNLVVSRHSVEGATDTQTGNAASNPVNPANSNQTGNAASNPVNSNSTGNSGANLPNASQDLEAKMKNNSGRKLQFQLENNEKTDEEVIMRKFFVKIKK